ncbi:MAG TPA: peptidyl-prolyl cis-trans isomerase [Blastocatellia bacterium]|jgi:parvulin-like peptidyl-prolyl isomerase
MICKVVLFALLILLLILLATGCRNASERSAIILTLNGREIHRDEFERFLSLKLGDMSAADNSDSIRSQMLDEYIKRRLVLDDATRIGLSVSTAEIEQTSQNNPQMNASTAGAVTRDELARDLLVEKYYRQVALRDVRVSPDEINQYIEKNQSRLTDRPGFLVREIRVASREQADRLRREVTEGGRDFALIARQHSDATGAEQNGLARYDEGQLPEALETAVKKLRPGEVSPVIESNYGFHIFKLEQIIKPHSLEERRSKLDDRRAMLADELIARKNQQAVDAIVGRLSAEATIKINDPALGFTYTGQMRHN